MEDEWQATQARSALPDIIDAAVAGRPQVIRRRDGKEVVVVSREYFDANKPSLRDYLLNAGYAGDAEDAFDRALEEARRQGLGAFAPRATDADDGA